MAGKWRQRGSGSRLFLDHALAALQVGVPHRGVEIEGHLFKFLEGFQIERPIVDHLSPRASPPRRRTAPHNLMGCIAASAA